MTQNSRSSSSISPTNSRSSLKRYNLSPTREREIAKKRAKWLKEKRLEEIHNKRKKEFIAKYNMERRKEEEEDRRRRNRSSRENRRDISPSAADPLNESTRPRAQPPHNRRRRSDSPVASTSAEVPRSERDSSSLATDLWNTLRALSESSQPSSRNDNLQRTLNSQADSRLLGRLIEILPDIDCTKGTNKVLFRMVFEELLSQLQKEDRRNPEPERRPPSPQGRRSQPSTSGTSRPLPVRGSSRSSRERSPRRESSRDRPRNRSRSDSRHRHPDSRDSNYRRSNQEGRSQRSPRRHSSSRDHGQHRAYRRPRSPQERDQRHDGGHSMGPLPPPPHQHSSAAAPHWSDYPASQNPNEWQLQPPRQLHPLHPPIRPPPEHSIYYDPYERPMEYLPPRFMVAPPMVVPQFRQPPPFFNWRGPRPQFSNSGMRPRYHGNRSRHPRPNSYRGNQQAPDTTQQSDANPSTARPRQEEGNDTEKQETSKK